jgi:hypothetical protein
MHTITIALVVLAASVVILLCLLAHYVNERNVLFDQLGQTRKRLQEAAQRGDTLREHLHRALNRVMELEGIAAVVTEEARDSSPGELGYEAGMAASIIQKG